MTVNMADRGSDTGTNVHVQESVFTHPPYQKKRKKRKEIGKKTRSKKERKTLTDL